jgi:hypothetical protein
VKLDLPGKIGGSLSLASTIINVKANLYSVVDTAKTSAELLDLPFHMTLTNLYLIALFNAFRNLRGNSVG